MKRSSTMLVTIGIALMLVLLISIFFVRKDLKIFIDQTENERYRVILLDSFKHVEISSGWNLRIRQGNNFRCLLNVADTVLHPKIQMVNGVLELSVDTSLARNHAQQVYAKVTLPSLLSIKAQGNTIIDVEDFKADSLVVTLLNGCRFKGQKNAFQNLVFNSSGDARIELRDEYSD